MTTGNRFVISGGDDSVPAGNKIAMERVLAGLRLVFREGSHVLQQAFEITEFENGNATVMRVEWRDVPIESEDEADGEPLAAPGRAEAEVGG